MLVEDLHSDLVYEGMRNPSAVVAVGDLTELVSTDLVHRNFVCLRVVLNWDLCRHAAHGSNSPPMGMMVSSRIQTLDVCSLPVAGLDEQTDVGVHEGNLHGDVRAIRQDSRAVGATPLDEAEDVVPSVRCLSTREYDRTGFLSRDSPPAVQS